MRSKCLRVCLHVNLDFKGQAGFGAFDDPEATDALFEWYERTFGEHDSGFDTNHDELFESLNSLVDVPPQPFPFLAGGDADRVAHYSFETNRDLASFVSGLMARPNDLEYEPIQNW